MPQKTAYKELVTLVPTNLVGASDRVGPRAKAGAELNYALRPSWGIVDRFRGMLASYYALFNLGHGLDFVNLAPGDVKPGNTGQQSQNIPLKVNRLPTEDPDENYLIELDNTAWNALAFNNISRDLLKQIIQEEGVNEGDPFWEYFLKSGLTHQSGDPHNPLPIVADIPAVFSNAGPFTDLTCHYYRASNDDAVRMESGLNLKVESVYNFYVDTTPPYEEISLSVSEPMLPNFYCLESEIRNTGSQLNSQDYFDQITLNNALQTVNIDNDAAPDPWFATIEGQPGRYDESTSVQFYTLYSKGVKIIRSLGRGPGDPLGVINNFFNERLKNIVILNSDLAAMSEFVIRDDKTSGLRNIPYYNKIVIGVDETNVADPNRLFNGLSFFSSLMNDVNFGGVRQRAAFMDILQLYIIQNILDGSVNSFPFMKKRITKTVASLDLDVSNASVPTCFDMRIFVNDIINDIPGGRLDKIRQRINSNVTTDDNFILIRNYNSKNSIVASTTAATTKFLLLEEDDRINYPVQDFDEILENKGCYSEPIMYKIDKRILNADGSVTEPVQTFFIGKSFENKEINFIDSQVKYGVRYRYDISQIRVVFGNRYRYKDLKIFFEAVAGSGRAVGNALGFYREPAQEIQLDDYIANFVKHYVTTDVDTGPSGITLDGNGTETTSLAGIYIFKATNFVDFASGPNQQYFTQLFTAGTDYVHSNPGEFPEGIPGSREILSTIMLHAKEGFGFDGNETGGAVGAKLLVPFAAPPAGGAQTPPTPEELSQLEGQVPPDPALLAGGAPPLGTPPQVPGAPPPAPPGATTLGPYTTLGVTGSATTAEATGPSQWLINKMIGGT